LRTFIALSAFAALSVATPAFADEVPAAAAPAAAEASSLQAKKGESIYTADGKRLGKIYQIDRAGNPQFIQDLRLLTVPAGTLSRVEGKLTTSLTRKEVK
jgi:sporulation protein YlmC with PRC-barrel domain